MDVLQHYEWEQKLTIGSAVIAKWTNSRNFLTAKATVVKINSSSIVARLEEDVSAKFGEWKKGTEFPFPRILTARFKPNPTFSSNNGLFPV